jgi:Domain of unknown function (DUF4252)
MRKLILSFLITIVVAVPVSAQKLNLEALRDLEDRAEEVVDVTLDATMLKMAARLFSKHASDPDERAIGDMIRGLEGIYVRSFEFAKTGEYDRRLVDQIKSQLGPTWKPLVTVRSTKKENVDIMADMRGERVVGLVIIAAEPRELTVVNIVGPIDIERLADLEGEFGIPKFSREKDRD